MKLFHLTFTLFFLFIGCNDRSVSTLYDKSYKSKTIPCLQLSIFPKNVKMQKTLEKSYPFKQKCEYLLLVSYKANIVCNSNQNAAKKTLSNFPNSYLRMEVNKDMNDLIFSYYKDLNDNVQESDLKNAFKSVKKNLKFN
ncbi:MAG: hypothetical protein QM482_02065 [Sulfurospirillum sp.]